MRRREPCVQHTLGEEDWGPELIPPNVGQAGHERTVSSRKQYRKIQRQDHDALKKNKNKGRKCIQPTSIWTQFFLSLPIKPRMFGRRSSSPRQGPSLKERKWDDKSGMQNMTEGPTKVKEKSQGCLDIIAAGTTRHNMTKTGGLRNGRHPEGNCSYPIELSRYLLDLNKWSLCFAICRSIYWGNTLPWSFLLFLFLPFLLLPLPGSPPTSRQRYVSLSCFCACDFTAWGKSVRKVTSFIKYSICIQNCMYMKNVVVCCT